MLTCDYSEQIASDVKVWKGEQVTQETQLSVIYFRTDTQQTWRLFVSDCFPKSFTQHSLSLPLFAPLKFF